MGYIMVFRQVPPGPGRAEPHRRPQAEPVRITTGGSRLHGIYD